VIELTDVMVSLCPTARWSVSNDQLIWHDDVVPCPDAGTIAAERERLAVANYRRQRAAAYPPIGDQLDDLFHSGAFSPEMTARLQSIKDQYPKP
jgi:hypothetical protein